MARQQVGKRSGQKKLAGKAMKKVRGGSITVNTNVNSVVAQRQLGKTQAALAASFARVSSGMGNDTAADDAIGLGAATTSRRTGSGR